MRTKATNDINNLNKVISNSYRNDARGACTYKYKVLPYLKSINSECQHIDYRIYERFKKNRKMQILRPDYKT
jgi:hypothetical protein